MPDVGDITEITAPVEIFEVEDRIHFTLTSGARKRTYSITPHKASNAAHIVLRLLEKRERAQADRISALGGVKNVKRGH